MKKFMQIVNEITSVETVEDFATEIEKTFFSQFPDSSIHVSVGNEQGSGKGKKYITIKYTLGKKGEYPNNISMNDPFYSMISIFGMKDENFSSTKIKAELYTGGKVIVDTSTTPSTSVKIGWRNKTATPVNIIKHLGNYFKKSKDVAKKYQDVLPAYVKTKI